jgi:TonB family protein
VSAATLALDHATYKVRARWTLSASAIVHTLLLMWLILAPHVVAQAPSLTEITLVEPGDLAASAPSAPAAAASPSSGAAVASTVERTFKRLTRSADITPEPESEAAVEDRIAARLAAIQHSEPAPVRGVGLAAPPSTAWGTPAPAATGVGSGTAPLALTRGGAGAGPGPALSLHRSGEGLAPALANPGLPASVSAASAPARGGDTAAQRQVAGAMLAGPIDDRPVVAWTSPVYPEWAKRDAVEGSVTLYFVVRPDGSVTENVLVQKTAGFDDFDENARAALRAWRFAPLGAGRTGDQWGTITFHFRLREAG